MSNSLAIAAVTATLRTLLDRGLPDGTTVTALPLDRARENNTGKQVNLFLYQVALNAAWRNMEIPYRARSGESAQPPLPLNLYYLLTVYLGDNDDDTVSHTLLGSAMSILHDHPLLGRDEIQAALPNNDLYAQIERIRLSLQPLSSDDIFKLWSSYQTQYRLSVAYEATVVLIESTIASSTPLPVLTIGKDNTGPTVVPSLVPPFPALDPKQEGLKPGQKGLLTGDLLTGDTVTLTGFNLHNPDAAVVRLRASIPPDPADIPVLAGGSETQVQFTIPDTLPAGFYPLVLAIHVPGEAERTTNAMPLALSATITRINGADPGAGPIAVAADGAGNVNLTVEFVPAAGPNQRVSLLFGSREIALPIPVSTTAVKSLKFVIGNVVPGTYRIRLRVDGVDSPLIDSTQKQPVYKSPQVKVGP